VWLVLEWFGMVLEWFGNCFGTVWECFGWSQPSRLGPSMDICLQLFFQRFWSFILEGLDGPGVVGVKPMGPNTWARPGMTRLDPDAQDRAKPTARICWDANWQ
jgi:hypothetical protein